MNFLMIDNADSFTFNLVDAFRVAGAEVAVVRNDIAAADALARAMASGSALLLSPGPGAPEEAGCLVELVRLARGRVPTIGICLGHQAIVAEAGGTVTRAVPCHGKVSALVHEGTGPFAGLPSPMPVGRYHSLCTPFAGLPARFAVDAALEGMAMAIRDDAARQLGLQFHPESILTPAGDRLVAGLLDWAKSARATPRAAA